MDLFSMEPQQCIFMKINYTYLHRMTMNLLTYQLIRQKSGWQFLKHLYYQFRAAKLGDQNGKGMFNLSQEMVIQYNNSWKVIHNSSTYSPFIICIVTGLMRRVHQKIVKPVNFVIFMFLPYLIHLIHKLIQLFCWCFTTRIIFNV